MPTTIMISSTITCLNRPFKLLFVIILIDSIVVVLMTQRWVMQGLGFVQILSKTYIGIEKWRPKLGKKNLDLAVLNFNKVFYLFLNVLR